MHFSNKNEETTNYVHNSKPKKTKLTKKKMKYKNKIE